MVSTDYWTSSQKEKELKEKFELTVRTIELLRTLRGELSEVTGAWHKFSCPNGDIHYFASFEQSHSPRVGLGSVRVVKETFDKLEGLNEKLRLLEDKCSLLRGDVSVAVSHCVSH